MKKIFLIIALITIECLGAVKTDTLKATANVLVIKDTVQFDKGLRLSATDSVLKTFKKGVMPCTVKTSDFTTQVIANAYWTKIGNVLTISFPKMTGTSNSTDFKVHCKFPYKPILTDGSSNSELKTVVLTNNGASIIGCIWVPEVVGVIDFGVGSTFSIGGFTNSGTKGISFPFSMTFITEN